MRIVLIGTGAAMALACLAVGQETVSAIGGAADASSPATQSSSSPAPSSPASSAVAPSAAPAPELPGERAWDGFHLDLTAGLWLPRVTGDVDTDDSQMKYSLVDDLGLSSQDTAFAGEIEARWGAWHVRVGGSQFSTSGGNISTFANTLGGVRVFGGDPTASDLTMWNFGGDVGVDLWRPFADRPFPFGPESQWAREHNTRADGGYKGDLRLGAFVGARAIGTDLDFVNLRTTQYGSIDETWTAVYVGGRVTVDIWLREHFPLLERISIDANASFGPVYPGTGSLVQVQAGITMYPCDNFGVQFGYRLLKMNGDGGGQNLDANFAGLFVGGVLHF